MNKFAILILSSLAVISTAAQTTQKFTAGKINEYGLSYTLPITELDVTIEVEKTVLCPGEFFRYSKKLIAMEPILEASTSYKVKSVTITPRGVADQSQQYLVQFKSGSTPFMLLNEENFPLSINTEKIMEIEAPIIPTAVEPTPTPLETPAAAQAMTAEMLQSTSSAKRAELAAARIFELRQSRNDIISGTAENMPSDGGAMQLALDNLTAQEQALTAMFIGTTQKSTEVATLIVRPDSASDNSNQIIARVSSLKGIVDASDLSGEPIYIGVKVTERGTLPKNEKGEVKRFPKGGFAYRIPGKAQVTASDMNGNELASQSVEVAQYGIVFGLDPNTFTHKKTPAYAILNPITGAITEIGPVQ